MKRLFEILTLCAAMAATAGLGANPAAADGRGDSRQHRQERLSDRDHDRTSWRHHRGNKHHWARKNQRMHYQFRRHHKRHRHALDHRPGPRYGPEVRPEVRLQARLPARPRARQVAGIRLRFPIRRHAVPVPLPLTGGPEAGRGSPASARTRSRAILSPRGIGGAEIPLQLSGVIRQGSFASQHWTATHIFGTQTRR